ncbi:MAG: type I restriction enzyme subunit R domain-containing protein, partial [Nitrososphaera sp.]
KILVVVDMLLVGYDVPIVQVLYLDKGLREHNLLQAIARVNRPYDENKTYGLIVDYSGITKELQKALEIFEEEDIKGALESSDKEFEDLKLRHLNAIANLQGIERNDDSAIIIRFEPVNKRDEFEYDFKEFSRALDAVLPGKEADPYINDFKYLSKIRQMIRTYYEGVGVSLRGYGKKVQQLIDDHIRSLGISELINPREITYANFMSYAAKFKDQSAKAALVRSKARQVIEEFTSDNPTYYEKLRERLEKLIEAEKLRRVEIAEYFAIIKDALGEQEERKKLGFSEKFEFACYGELLGSKINDSVCKKTAIAICSQIKPETQILGWRNKTSSEKRISIIIYDILQENGFPEEKFDELVGKISELARRLL